MGIQVTALILGYLIILWGTATVTVRVGTLILNVQYGGWNGTPTHRTPIEERKARTEAATLARTIIKHLR